MPVYLYEDDRNGRIFEFIQTMNEPHVAFHPDDGYELKRVYCNPQLSIDTEVDPYSAADFVKATNKKDTYGAMLDRSKELSLKRQDKDGIDIVKEAWYNKWSKERKGKKHPDKIKQEAASKLKQKGVTIVP